MERLQYSVENSNRECFVEGHNITLTCGISGFPKQNRDVRFSKGNSRVNTGVGILRNVKLIENTDGVIEVSNRPCMELAEAT